ncbi:acetylornithine transaminase [Desulfurivibrio alkaliphilus]|uniref:Acetylornithine aminotransferase n=1 Tax=Desulfurivibrio alkaliphilus (strain DSM 19089 / UNIQEM U267 / AHT2) TaxID=589865 RepID=D6Z6B0_DESAT|nr:acetylornithine transaminase [Desulfurivibrio alkaliphilus]ADH86875.1 acetylornithine and succinylornithine aminotransferase [Desulfurivibrio alkaliphilus AHT 2]
MSENEQWNQRGNRVLMNTYGRLPVTMVRGDGCTLHDADGREYLDFVAGIAVCNLGHCHPAVTAAVREQAEKLVHVSNLYHTVPQIELAERLCDQSFADRVFFCNSGAEANEAAIKLARKAGGEGRYEIISLTGSFHGRTLATVAATGQSKFHEGFEPLPAGFIHAPFGDLVGLERLIGPQTCAVLCEPLQGEGGVRPLAPEYLQGIRELCNRHGLLLIFDEVQVGMGRTGSLLAHEQLGVTPDIITLAKGLANGLPMGAMLAGEEVAAAFTPGSHASTFGGNPLAAAAALAVLDTLLSPDFLAEVREKGAYLAAGLNELVRRYPDRLQEVRGLGLIQGLVLQQEFREQGPAMVQKLFERGLLLNFAGNTALRFIPPLVVSRPEIDRAVELVAEVVV